PCFEGLGANRVPKFGKSNGKCGIEEVIDHYIDAKIQKGGVNPAPLVDDYNFIRRVTLDLAGRIPLTSEVEQFVANTDPAKRVALVDHLLASPDFVYHQRNEFSLMLLPPDQQDGAFREYLLQAFQQNRPWDRLFAEMMLSRDSQEDKKAALVFLKKRAGDIDDLTNDTSKIFFGVSINCAKCHDHPLVDDWKQDHYFGMSQFFRGTWLTKKNFLAEREFEPVSFKTTAGEDKRARMMFLTGQLADVPPPLPEPTEAEKKATDERRKAMDESETPPTPALFSAREQLVDLALQPEGAEYFSKSIVNRLWERLLGMGLVNPVDQMHSGNPASHPQLLRWLARDMRDHDYELKRMIRGIVLSQTYARSSRWNSSAEKPTDSLFAVGSVRALTPMQYSLSLRLATFNPEQIAQQVQDDAVWVNRRRDLENQSQGFAGQIDVPGENFQVSITESLLFSNGPQVQNEFLAEGGDRLLTYILTLTDPTQQIPKASLAVLSRQPEADETAQYQEFLNARAERPTFAWQQLLWALLAGSEFRFNY
ncbi:MAG: DUF1549 domain-containing protein, partial [Planctomycetota bacterium]|nr:DUF1549 domain-containing protein [Planctomycetota bacterium]MDA1215057.1 DUF1549 domain-containing protein [Planctomycetota bacterium]